MAAAAGALSEAAARLGRAVATAPQTRLESVRALTGLFREAQPREMAEESMFRNLLEILMSTSSEIEQVYKDSCGSVDLHTCLLLIAECFRCLRNACVECAKNQNVMRNLGLISTSVHLIKLLHGIQIKEELLLTALRCSLQFLGNVAAGNGDSQNSIWKCAFPDLFLTCLTYDDQKIVTYCCMVLFNCLNSEKVRELLDPGNMTVTLHVLKVYKEQLETEWSFLIVTDHLLKCPELVEALYAKLSNQERVTLLELMMAKVSEKNPVTSEEMNVFMRHANFLAGCFQEKCEAVLKLTSAADAEDEEALVTIRLLDVLCEMTSNNRQLEHLQALPGLLETAIDTLRLTHLAGKQAVNIFTATHVMTGLEEISHPAVGFKSHLIRLIGNLCYKNKENQDKVASIRKHVLVRTRQAAPIVAQIRKLKFGDQNELFRVVHVSDLELNVNRVYELDGIPLILDNCSIDDNNPCYFMSKSNKKISTLISNRYEDDYGQLRTNFLYPLQRLFERDACQSYSFEILTVDLLINWFCECLNLIGMTLFVNQWAVYAIRNLTEQNERNQELIAQMEEKGLTDNSALESMGLEIEKRDDKLILRSVRKKPS